MDKKGQGISMNVIIIAAIALLVLVVVAAIFLVNMGKVQPRVNECEPTYGTCVASGGCNDGIILDKNCGDDEEGPICCSKGGGSDEDSDDS
jgi:hypothetical protein